jgi:hypothetical protein
MAIKDIKTNILKLNDIIKSLKKKNIDISDLTDNSALTDYESQKLRLAINQLKNSINYLQKNTTQISIFFDENNKNTNKKDLLISIINKLDISDFKLLESNISELINLISDLKIEEKRKIRINTSKIPIEIRDEILADINEMNNCFSAKCYRSVVILCGRIIEVLLHRKYYDATGMDILEKNPGIGLGKLIAKLSEKGIELQPGLTHQIHLINQVRIFSVHKKQTSFNPSESQTHAIMLFMTDTIDKLYLKKR